MVTKWRVSAKTRHGLPVKFTQVLGDLMTEETLRAELEFRDLHDIKIRRIK